MPKLPGLFGRLQTTAQSPTAAAKFTATIETDREDYPPNTQVNVTGDGWLPHELVELTFTETATMPPGGFTDGPFIFYATSDAHGDIANGDFYTDEHDAGVSFRLNAKGVISGRTAQTTFTDGLGSLDQCANGSALASGLPSDTTPCQSASEWVNGNLGASKSTYFEGDSIPYRLTMSGLSTSATHTVTIEWDTTKSGKHAIDYLTTFNRSLLPAGSGNPCTGVTGTGCNPPTVTPFAIPVDPQLAGAGAGGKDVVPPPGNFLLYGGTISEIVTTSNNGYSYANGAGFVGDKSARLTIRFTASVANPVLAWGGHIATRTDWGVGNSAVAISGSPYHTRLVEIDGSGGNQDRSLSADAVTFPGSITIIKQATPEGNTVFPFTASPAPPLSSSFSLVDDNTATNTKVFSNILIFQDYTITEGVTSGWALDTIACPLPSSPNGGSATTTKPSAVIKMKEGEDWTCTFSNSAQPGTLIVKKVVVNNNGGTKIATNFTFQVGQDSPITFLQDTDTLHGKNTLTKGAGTYTITEPAVAGYTPSYDNCIGVVLTNGGTQTCTITNTAQPGTLIVKKVVDNTKGGTKIATDFSFQVNNGSATTFTQDADTLHGKNTLTPLDAGTYTITEVAVTGYTPSYDNCTGVVLANGGEQTCTITNTAQSASLKIVKRIINNNGGTKTASDFGITTTAGSLTFDAGTPDGADTVKYTSNTITNLSAGSKGLHENLDAGYDEGTWACVGNAGAVDGNAQTGSVVVGIGESVTCTITNNDVKAAPGRSTDQRAVLHDSIEITGIRTGGTPVASVTFSLYTAATCGDVNAVPLGTEQRPIAMSNTTGTAGTLLGVPVDPAPVGNIADVTYAWKVTYSGDSFNEGFTTACSEESTRTVFTPK
jgi:hypothetical protein